MVNYDRVRAVFLRKLYTMHVPTSTTALAVLSVSRHLCFWFVGVWLRASKYPPEGFVWEYSICLLRRLRQAMEMQPR